MQGVYKNGKEFGVLPTDKFEKPSDIDEKSDCSSLTGFHSNGSMGGTFDFDYTGVVDYVDPLQSFNTSDTEGDTIDFNQ